MVYDDAVSPRLERDRLFPTGRRRALVALAMGAATLVPRAALADGSDPDPWFGPDKALHFGASAAIAGGAYAVSTQLFDGVGARTIFAGSVALGAGILKEALDAAGLGDPSWKDLAWDVAGTAVGLGVSISIDLATRPTSASPAH
jgi:putative lipoprotein